MSSPLARRTYAEVVHAIVQNQFGTGRGGLPGNDDSGGLSSWFVWATLGLFPVAGQNLFLISTPAWRESRITVAGGALTISTSGFVEPTPDGPAQYIRSVRLDGAPLERPWLTGAEMHRGGRLLIELGPAPSGWGVDVRPPSWPMPLPS